MKLLVTLCSILYAGLIAATPLHQLVVFGDSLSDNGNLYEFMKHQLPQSPPYFDGRFTNGLVWIEDLNAFYFPETTTHLLNYAMGGAGVAEDIPDDEDVLFTLKKEVKTYLLSHDNKASADALYIVWIGANNYLGLPEDVDMAVHDVTEGISNNLQQLVDKGAKHIMVMNLPDLGKTPAALEFDAVDAMHQLAQAHNQN